MKTILLVLAATIYITPCVTAQDATIQKLKEESSKTIKKDPNDTTQKIWKKGGIYGINISQGSLSNWAAGGDNFSLSVNSLLNLFAFYKKDKHSWDNTFDFNLGYVKTTSLGSRKNDDRIDFLSKYGYAVSKIWNVGGLVNFRSQLFNGYTYSNDVKSLASAFLSPAYIIVSPGLDYKPNQNFSAFISPITSRWVVVKNDSLSDKGLYGVEPGKHSVNELGAYATINYFKSFNPNVTYKGRLDLFSNYKNNPQNVDVYLTNVLNFKISKAISATYSLDIIYDDDARLFGKNKDKAATQLKSLLGIGLLMKF